MLARLGMLNPGMSCFLLAFVSWVWIGTVKLCEIRRRVERHRPAWFRQPFLASGRRDMFFLGFCISNWRSVQRNLFASPCDVKCCTKHQETSRNAVFVAWGLQMGFAWHQSRGGKRRPLASLAVSVACVATKALRRRAEWVLRGNVFVTLANRIKHSWSFLLMLQDKGYRFGAEWLKSHDF